jgi:hypothetical protein
VLCRSSGYNRRQRSKILSDRRPDGSASLAGKRLLHNNLQSGALQFFVVFPARPVRTELRWLRYKVVAL